MEHWYAICPTCRAWWRLDMHPEIPVPLPMIFCRNCWIPLWWNLAGRPAAAPVC